MICVKEGWEFNHLHQHLAQTGVKPRDTRRQTEVILKTRFSWPHGRDKNYYLWLTAYQGIITEKEAKLVLLITCSVKFFAKNEPGLYSECLKCQPEFFPGTGNCQARCGAAQKRKRRGTGTGPPLGWSGRKVKLQVRISPAIPSI